MNKTIILDLDLVIFSNPQQNGAQWVNGVGLYVTSHDRVLVRLFGAERCWFLHGIKACDGTCRDFAIAVKYRDQLRKLYWLKTVLLHVDTYIEIYFSDETFIHIADIGIELLCCYTLDTLWLLHRHFIEIYFQVFNLGNSMILSCVAVALYNIALGRCQSILIIKIVLIA